MMPPEQGATRTAPIIHNRIVGKPALFDGLGRSFDTLPQHDTTRNLHGETGVIHRPLKWCGAGPAPSLSFALTSVRERSADWRYFLVWHLVEGARVPCGHAASRRSTVASSTPGPSRRVRIGDFHPRKI